jgi:hypothetical protein
VTTPIVAFQAAGAAQPTKIWWFGLKVLLLSKRIDIMKIREQVLNFDLEGVSRRLLEDPESVFRDIEFFSSRDLSISEVGVEGIDSKILYVWKNKGLLPHHVEKKGKRIWGKFSFIEVCWLKLLIELRSVGIGMEKLKEITDFFHPPGFIDQFFGGATVKMEMLHPAAAKKVIEKNLVKNGKVQIDEKAKAEFEKIQFSLFSYLLYATIMLKANFALFFDGRKKFDLINLDEIEADPLKGVIAIKDMLDNQSVVIVNIRKIIADISSTHEYFSKKAGLGLKISETSIQLLKKQFEENNVEEVTIRADKGGRPVIYLSQQMNFDDIDREIRKLTKKGTFRDIIIKSRDGRLKYFERTEVIKL